MINDALLISPEFIKLNSNISDNLNEKVLATAIREAQSIDLQQIIGQCLLDKLKELVMNEEIYIDENIAYKELLDQAQFFLAYTAIAKVVMLVNYKIDNVGVVTTRDENIDNITLDEAFQIQDHYQAKADHYAYMLENYVLEHQREFPELSGCQCRKIKATLYSASNSKIWLGGARGRNGWVSGWNGYRYNKFNNVS